MKQAFLILVCLLSLFSARGAETPFRWSRSMKNGKGVLGVEIQKNHYLYVDEVAFTPDVKPESTPVSVSYRDPYLGDVRIYPEGAHRWVFALPAPMKVAFQGCRKEADGESAICFLPNRVDFSSESPAATAAATPPLPSGYEWKRVSSGLMNESEFLRFLGGERIATSFTRLGFRTLLLALLGGLALNLTPCVLPLIPVNLAIIGASGGGRKGFLRGLAYGGGMAAAYGALGLAAALAGARFGVLNASPAFNWGVAILFLLLTPAMLGWFNVDFSRFRTRFKLKGNGIFGVVVMGALAALLAGACVAPAVIGAIVLASTLWQQGDPTGLVLPFVLGIGMALPWPLAGAGFAALPRPGRWMTVVKGVFAVILFGMAIHFGYTAWKLGSEKDWSAAGEFAALQEGMREAELLEKPLLVEFGASWCGNCRAMERTVLTTPSVQKALEGYVVVRFRAERPSDPLVKSFLDTLLIPGLPAFAVLEKTK